MTSQSEILPLAPAERAQYGFARVRDLAFDSMHELWLRRKNEGFKQVDIANAIGRDTGWVSKVLRGPANLTLRTWGEMIEALGGEVEIRVHALQDPHPVPTNFDAYIGYNPVVQPPQSASSSAQVVVGAVQ